MPQTKNSSGYGNKLTEVKGWQVPYQAQKFCIPTSIAIVFLSLLEEFLKNQLKENPIIKPPRLWRTTPKITIAER